MSSVCGSSLLAVQAYASQGVGPARPGTAPARPAEGRAGQSAFSVELSKAARDALKVDPAKAGDAEFQPFRSAEDMGARAQTTGTSQDFRREAPLRATEPQTRYQRPGGNLDIRV